MNAMNTSKGRFVISIDLEYGWGYWDHTISNEQKEKIRGETDIIFRLLDLFDQYKIPATWAIVGKLLEEGSDPLWHDVDGVIKTISEKEVKHEIASHSYSHIIYSESSRSEVSQDIEQAKDVHEKNSLSFDSFVFPRNGEGYHNLLRESGLSCYRGNTRYWYSYFPAPLSRFFHFLHYFFPSAPAVKGERGEAGMINIPDSMLLLSRKGIRSIIPPSLMVLKAIRGLKKATKKSEIFHLWFHPSNFSYAQSTQFRILESILEEARKMRERGELEVLTMRDIAQIYE